MSSGAENIFFFRKLYATFHFLLRSEAGKDLVEYALVVTLIAFGAVTGMNALSGVLTKTFQEFSTMLGSYVS